MSPAAAESARLSPATHVGAVSLTVSDLARAREFYETALGLQATARDDGSIALGAPAGPAAAGDRPLVILHDDPGAPARDPHAPGLFHVALLLPSRHDLADALLRLARVRWPLSGASDHLVSEALYLDDPEGNGIELYRDRPREQWPHDAQGALEMATLRLDLQDLAAESGSDAAAPDGETAPGIMPAGTRVGHVHLQVSDIPRAEAFYADLLGLQPTVRGYPGALFVAAGGYHHHVGLNTWNSAGAPPATPGATGLRSFEIVVGDTDELARVGERLRAGGIAPDPRDDGAELRVRDPFANTVVLRAA